MCTLASRITLNNDEIQHTTNPSHSEATDVPLRGIQSAQPLNTLGAGAEINKTGYQTSGGGRRKRWRPIGAGLRRLEGTRPIVEELKNEARQQASTVLVSRGVF